MKNWMVYFINCDGHREGVEKISANTREEAIEIYRRYFNIDIEDKCKAIPIFNGNIDEIR